MSKTKPACACGGETMVIDSRLTSDWRRRRHRCVVCGEMFTTIEIKCDAVGQGRYSTNKQLRVFAERIGGGELARVKKITGELLRIVADYGELP